MNRVVFLLEKALLVVATCCTYFMWSLARSPQLHANDWYARGGLRRTVQVVATDVLGTNGILLLAVIAAVFYVGPRRIIDVARRVLELPMVRSSRRIIIALAIVAGVAAFAQPVIHRSPEASTDKPNVLLVVVDSFRADRFDALVTPNLSKLALKGTRFDRAYASSPQTQTSWKAILTGRRQQPSRLAVPVPVPVPDLVSLPDRFAKAGYAIAELEDARRTSLPDPARIVDDLEDAIRTAGNRPFLATAAFSTPRFPYASPPPYYARYADRAYRGRFKYDAGREPLASNLDDADVRQIQALSDGALAAVDDAIGRLWESLERHALAERTVVVVVGTDPSTHVPLLVIDGRATKSGGRNNSVVRDLDLAATLYELAHVEAPPNLDGTSLASALRGEALEPRLAFSEDDSPDQPLVMRTRMVRDERFKLAYVPTRTSPQHLLFDTLLDPAEEHDVGSTHPADLARLRDELWTWMLADPTMEKRDGYLLPKEAPPPFTNVLWIAVEGLRSETSPAIDALALRGARFDQAYASPSEFAAATDPLTISGLLKRKGIPFTFATLSTRQAPPPKLDQQIEQLLQRANDKSLVVLTGSDETMRVPVIIVAPGAVPPNVRIASRVRTIDIAPTVLDLVGIERPLEMRGASLLPLARGVPEPERVVVAEGKGTRAIFHGPWRFVVRTHRPSQLFDVADEAHDLAAARPDVVAEMNARLDAAMANVAVTSATATVAPTAHLRLRFAGAAAARRVSGVIRVGDAKWKANTYEVCPVDLGPETLRDERGTLDVAFRTSPGHAVGFDIIVDPLATPITWDLWLEDGPWPNQGVFAGPFGLWAPELRQGLTSDDARAKAQARAFPFVDPSRELGLFVTRELK